MIYTSLLYTLCTGILFGLAISPLYAVTTTPTSKPSAKEQVSPTAAEEAIDKLKQIKILKEKIATKVAELRDKEKTSLAGTIVSIQGTTLTISTKKGEKTINLADDIEVFTLSSSGKSASTIKKLTQGAYVSAIGYLDDIKQTLVPSRIYIEQTPYLYLSGKIVDIDKTNFTLTIKGKAGQSVIDIEKYTKTSYYEKKTDTIQKSGFSKMTVGDSIHVVGTAHASEKDRFSAQRLLTFPSLSPSPAADEPQKTSSPSAILPSKTP